MSSTLNIKVAQPQKKIDKTPISRGAVFRKGKAPKVDKTRVSRGAVWEKNPKKVDRSPVARQAVMTKKTFQVKGIGKGRKRVSELMTSRSYRLSTDRFRNNDAERTAGQKPRTAWWNSGSGDGSALNTGSGGYYHHYNSGSGGSHKYPLDTSGKTIADNYSHQYNEKYMNYDVFTKQTNPFFGSVSAGHANYYNPIYSDPFDKDDHPHAVVRLRMSTGQNLPKGGDINDGPKSNIKSIRRGDGQGHEKGTLTSDDHGHNHRNEAGWPGQYYTESEDM